MVVKPAGRNFPHVREVDVTGQIHSLEPAAGTVTIAHEEIPDFILTDQRGQLWWRATHFPDGGVGEVRVDGGVAERGELVESSDEAPVAHDAPRCWQRVGLPH